MTSKCWSLRAMYAAGGVMDDLKEIADQRLADQAANAAN